MTARNEKEIVLFQLVRQRDTHDVMYWPGYGVVMPSSVTSNGSPMIVARQVMDLINHWGHDYRTEAGEIVPDISSVEALCAQLTARMEEEK